MGNTVPCCSTDSTNKQANLFLANQDPSAPGSVPIEPQSKVSSTKLKLSNKNIAKPVADLTLATTSIFYNF